MELVNRNYRKVVDAVKSDPEQRPMLALAFALMDAVEDVHHILMSFEFPERDLEDQALCYEAKMYVAATERRPLEEIKTLAEEAVRCDSTAIFALYFLGQIAERQKHLPEALARYSDALKLAPQNDTLNLAVARVLLRQNQPKRALQQLDKVRFSLLKAGYWLVGWLLYSRWRLLFFGIYALLIGIPATAIYAGTVFGMLFFWGAVLALLKRETFLLRSFTNGILLATILFLIRLLIAWLLKI